MQVAGLSVNGDASTNLEIDVSQEVNVFLRLVTRIHRKSNDIRRLARLFLCHPIKIHRFKRLKWHSCRETYCELRTLSRKRHISKPSFINHQAYYQRQATTEIALKPRVSSSTLVVSSASFPANSILFLLKLFKMHKRNSLFVFED